MVQRLMLTSYIMIFLTGFRTVIIHSYFFSFFLEQYGARNNTKKYVIVLTDGRSNEDQLTKQEAALLKQMPNVAVLVFGIGSSVDNTELNIIASRNQNVFRVLNFDLLHTFQTALKDETCTR